MKTKKVKVLLTLEQVETRTPNSCIDFLYENKYFYTFSTTTPFDTETLEHFIEVEEAETLKEFRELKNVSKEEIVEFLNQNF